MEKCLFSLESDDAISQFRASNFKPVPDFRAVISDFDKSGRIHPVMTEENREFS